MKIDFSKENLLFLAPLAGYTDLPFRQVVKKFGVDVTISEMMSSNALIYNSKKTISTGLPAGFCYTWDITL